MQPAGIAKPGWLNYTMTLRVLPLGVRTAAAPPSARCIIIAGSTAVRWLEKLHLQYVVYVHNAKQTMK